MTNVASSTTGKKSDFLINYDRASGEPLVTK
jgi:hypothetical protein